MFNLILSIHSKNLSKIRRIFGASKIVNFRMLRFFGAYKTVGFVAVKIENFHMPQTHLVFEGFIY